ncbi:MAG: ribosome recycling factor [Clostridia bacterium]|nr:ribosome recycling factor [Clostridia bacterium]
MKLELKDYEAKMTKSISSYESELKVIRAGQASAAVLDRITVDYYGTPTAINQLANITTPDPRTLCIAPWETNLLKEIEKAINSSDLGINPSNDGKVIRLAFPVPTEERRKELTKTVDKYAEEVKVALRNIRRDANDKCKDMKKNGEMTEDEQKASEKNIQDLTDKYVKKADEIADSKKKEIMSI